MSEPDKLPVRGAVRKIKSAVGETPVKTADEENDSYTTLRRKQIRETAFRVRTLIQGFVHEPFRY